MARELEVAAPPRSSRGEEGAALSEEFRQEIREFARALGTMNYYEILGVDAGAGPEAIREAFFERSRRFHPDRYFGKDLGVYGGLLHEIYKRVASAHDVLRDPELRAEYDASSGVRAREVVSGAPAEGAARRPAGPSLRNRRGLRRPALQLLEERIAHGRDRARRLLEQASSLAELGEHEQAAAQLRLAVALDPRDERYRRALDEVRPRAQEARAGRILAQAEAQLARHDFEGGVAGLEEVAELRPLDALLAHRVAEVCAEALGDAVRALRHARRAVELAPQDAGHRLLLGRLLRRTAEPDAAWEQFERALGLDPENRDVKAELRALRGGR